ncbi:MAG: hypothetical protein H3C38_14335 [Rhodospirillales bacterium]|nr:hypothetical protein [Rhodospirillales bacterium]
MSRLALTRLAALLLAVIVALNPPLLEAAQERVADARAHLHQAGDESASDHADQHCDPTCQTVAAVLVQPSGAMGPIPMAVPGDRRVADASRGTAPSPDPPPPRAFLAT